MSVSGWGARVPDRESGSGRAAIGNYVFDNDSAHAAEQHRCLTAMLDPMSIERLAATGIRDGWRCLEVGAGGGSIARWLARAVAPTGHVVATDIKPAHIAPATNLEVVRHDVTTDALPEEAYDLIHARLVLLHLPERMEILDRLVQALRPGGVIQLDEFDITYGPALLMPDAESGTVYQEFLDAKARLLSEADADIAWGQHVPAAMAGCGLEMIDVAIHLQTWTAGSPGVQLLLHHTHHLRDRLLAAGLSEAKLDQVRALLQHPEFMASSCAIYSVQGRRPRTAA